VNDYSDWFAAELTGWDALRYTQRGVAPSVTEGPFTIERHVADAVAVLDQHGVAAATVLGHSWGGYLAMQLTARAPGRVSALVLAEPLGAVGDGGLAGFGAELAARATPEARARVAELDELSPTSKEQEAAVALESFRLDWPGYFAVPADAPPVILNRPALGLGRRHGGPPLAGNVTGYRGADKRGSYPRRGGTPLAAKCARRRDHPSWASAAL